MHVKLDEINLFHKKILIDFDSNNKNVNSVVLPVYNKIILVSGTYSAVDTCDFTYKIILN